jgi:hypothetical protein
MTQARWQLALRAHREAHHERLDRGHARLMFVACDFPGPTARSRYSRASMHVISGAAPHGAWRT